MKKKQYTIYTILPNGSSIKKKSLKNQKIFELFKDNYNLNYISNLYNKKLLYLSKETSTHNFIKKFKY